MVEAVVEAGGTEKWVTKIDALNARKEGIMQETVRIKAVEDVSVVQMVSLYHIISLHHRLIFLWK